MIAALAREVTQAKRAMSRSCPGTDEYAAAVAWRDAARKPLIRALGGGRFCWRCLLYRLLWAGHGPKRTPLTFFLALRRVHRPSGDSA